MPAIEVHDLVVRYGNFDAVKAISFEAVFGEITTLLGPNGAGKTTTVETIEGFRKPTSGAVRVLGLDPITQHGALVSSLGVMLQDLGNYPQLPPLRALNLFASYYENPKDPLELLEAVSLSHVSRTPAKRLSGGERQRLALALALIGRPRVVFLDEPTSGIDPNGRIAVRSIITSLRDEGVAVVLTTHELVEAERLADHVIIISEGHVVADGSLADLTRKPDVIRFETSAPIEVEELEHSLGARVERQHDGSYIMQTDDATISISALTAWLSERNLSVTGLHSGRESLESLFVDLTSSTNDQPLEQRSRRRQRNRNQ